MSKESRDAFYAQDALEFEKHYAEITSESESDAVLLPMTKAGFELLLAKVCQDTDIPIDDGARSTLAGYIHHIPPDECEINLSVLTTVLHKAAANGMTWQVDQEVKAKNKKAETKEEPILSVVDSADVPPPQGA